MNEEKIPRRERGKNFPIAILKKTMLSNLHVMMLTNLLRWNVRLPLDFRQEKIANHLKFVLLLFCKSCDFTD